MKFWNSVPDVSQSELKAIFKKRIWQYHWEKDIASASSRDSPFSSTLIVGSHNSTYPHKSHYFINSFMAFDLSRAALSSILRFWMTPSRQRICSCTHPTINLVKHLLFDCPRTRTLFASYRSKLSPKLKLILKPSSLSAFFSRIKCSGVDLRAFNSLVAEFNYPRFLACKAQSKISMNYPIIYKPMISVNLAF